MLCSLKSQSFGLLWALVQHCDFLDLNDFGTIWNYFSLTHDMVIMEIIRAIESCDYF